MDYRRLIQLHEGLRTRVYTDTLGNLTVGWGHCFGPSGPMPKEVFTFEECEELFDDDMQEVERDFIWLEDTRVIPKRLGWVRRAVLKDMLFNLNNDIVEGLFGIILR